MIKRYLYVKGALRKDATELCARMNVSDKPKSINWGDWVHISTGGRSLTCKLLGDNRLLSNTRLYNIRLNNHLRNILKVEVNRPYDFYIEKASVLFMPLYIVRYHPNDATRIKVGSYVVSAIIAILIAIVFGIISLL